MNWFEALHMSLRIIVIILAACFFVGVCVPAIAIIVMFGLPEVEEDRNARAPRTEKPILVLSQ